MQVMKCCGREMRLSMESQKFRELYCEECGDVVYVKKERSEKPQMLDD